MESPFMDNDCFIDDYNYNDELKPSNDELTDSDLEYAINELVKGVNNQETNTEPDLKRQKTKEVSSEERELKIMHKKYGCYQCRDSYIGNVDKDYHERLNTLFYSMKETISKLNKIE